MSGSSPDLVRIPRDRPLACSFAQERIWRACRRPEGSLAYTLASQMRIGGSLDVDALRAAIQYAVSEQELLRTAFVERDGKPLQVVGVPPEIEIPMIELEDSPDLDAAIEATLRRLALEPFDLEVGPLLRMWLVRVADDDHRLLRLNHHIVTDWLSWRIFFTDVARAYEARHRGEALPDSDVDLQYADFAVWERERLRPDGPLYREQLEWWRRTFGSEFPALSLPFSRAAPAPDAPPSDGQVQWELAPGEPEALGAIAGRAGTTTFVVRLALFSAQLGLTTGQEEMALGAYAMNRPPGESQSMFGFFSNPITLILRFDPKLSFRRWLARVREVVTQTKTRSEIPYDLLCEELHRGGSPPPEIRAIFSLRGRWPPLEPAGLELDAPDYRRTGMPWGFTFGGDPHRERERCSVSFDPRIYDPEAVRDFAERHAALVHRVVAKPNRRLRRLRP